MRDFDKEREFQLKLKNNRRAEVPRMKERPRGLRATYSSLFNSLDHSIVDQPPK